MSLQINDLVVENTLSASGLTATTLFVGTNIIGGTISNFNSLSATTLSGGTIYSGGTDLYNIFLTTNDGNDITRVQPGSNITTGGTPNNPIVSLTSSPSVNNFLFSGTATGNALSATTLSGGTILSGSTNLYSIFAPFGSSSGVNSITPGSNITTGGTATNPTISVVASPSFNNITFSGTATGNALSATTLSGGTIFSGNTNLQTYFTLINQQLLTEANLSGATFTGQVNAPSLSATTLSGGTILSASTNLYQIFAKTGSTLIHKSGTLSGSTFAGNPKKSTVTFATAFANTNYAITITSDTNRTWTWESKAAGSFVINANSNTAFATGSVDWTATEYGEK
jgi:hypothetical protein